MIYYTKNIENKKSAHLKYSILYKKSILWYNSKMGQFKWTTKYSVGIKSIDEQHQHFFKVANLLVETALNDASTKEGVIAMLGSLGDYAFYHLKTEEDYFNKFKYPDAAEHIAEHNKFRDQVKGYLDLIGDEKTDIKKLGKEAAIFSGNWLYHHILLVDIKYSKFFIEKGLE